MTAPRCPICALHGGGLVEAYAGSVSPNDAYLAGLLKGWAGASVSTRNGRLDEIEAGLCETHRLRVTAFVTVVERIATRYDQDHDESP